MAWSPIGFRPRDMAAPFLATVIALSPGLRGFSEFRIFVPPGSNLD
jgi:hypothetical protein